MSLGGVTYGQQVITNTTQLSPLNFVQTSQVDILDQNGAYLHTEGVFECWKAFKGSKCKGSSGVCATSALVYDKNSGVIISQTTTDFAGNTVDPSNLRWDVVDGEDEVYW